MRPSDIVAPSQRLRRALTRGFGAVALSASIAALAPPARAASEAVIYAFKGSGDGTVPADGALPAARLLNVGGTLYGTTAFGGQGTACQSAPSVPSGCGTLFSVTVDGVETVLHSFSGADGQQPMAGVIDVGGLLYGTTTGGGINQIGFTPLPGGFGVLYSATSTGAVKVINFFGPGEAINGLSPSSELLNVGGAFFGTTQYTFPTDSGPGDGIMFLRKPSGRFAVVHIFLGASQAAYGTYGGPDGSQPLGGLADVSGILYGTTSQGGGTGCGGGCGTVFKYYTKLIDQLNYGAYPHIIYSFQGSGDGASPEATLLDVHGVLYGTTRNGGGAGCESGVGCGTVFTVTTSGSEQVLHSFAGSPGDGSHPVAGLVNVHGTLYGTTSTGGKYGFGTVFKVTQGGVVTTAHDFAGGADGASPLASLVNVGGTLYGTTYLGGSSGCGGAGCGTVFRLIP